MSTDDTGIPEQDPTSRDEDETTRERSAEERSIVAPTPKDVRAKADGDDEEPPAPPAADTRAP
ncbi:hypothetical protein [Kitasatospora sp. NPDC097643]|uniref:hypothetical protein n=1 Tax=Kitasatospora sp. NPDC097643 TaxID=3157230 RepID=UPI0033190157